MADLDSTSIENLAEFFRSLFETREVPSSVARRFVEAILHNGQYCAHFGQSILQLFNSLKIIAMLIAEKR